MQLTDKTMTVLENFSSIQSNLVVQTGNVLKTIAEARNIVAIAKLDQEFPTDFGIYELSEFLGVLGLVDTPTLTFDDEFLTVADSNGTSKVRYFYSPTDFLTSPKKDVNFPDVMVKFKLTKATLEKVKRASSTLGHDKLVIEPNNGSITLTVTDPADETANNFKVEVPADYEDGSDFSYVMNIGNLKMIPDDYDVSLPTKTISKFESASGDIIYYIALDKTSTYGGE